MKQHATAEVKNQDLEEILREGARKLLQQAIEQEVMAHIEKHKDLRDSEGKRLVVRNGRFPERTIMTGLGGINIHQPRVADHRGKKFSSIILPRYMRRLPSINALIPALYLKGVSTGDFSEALQAILGKEAPGLSPTNITRLKEGWEVEYTAWNSRDLSQKHYVYIWVDGIYFNVRLNDDRPCLLIAIGALEDGTKELIAIHDGTRESKLSWQELLRDLKKRNLTKAPALAIGDGALGFWAALEEEFPSTKQQRCWVHKTANVLDKLPKSMQASAKQAIHEMYNSPNKKTALKAHDDFLSLYEAKYPRACECLKKDTDVLFSFYDFPAEQWLHIRTTNPIESTFATVRHRTRQTKGCGSRKATLTMVFKLVTTAEKHWKRLRGCKQIEKVIKGIKFIDGMEQENAEKVA